jgi:hypothetical protein
VSWVYLPEPAEACLPPGCSVGTPSAQSRSTHTASAYSHSASGTGTSSRSRSGMTLSRSTARPGAVVSTSSLAASRARTLAAPDAVQALTESAADYGSKCSASLAKFGLRMSSPKTLQCSALADWVASSRGLPTWGMMLRGVCSELTTSVRRISGTECGSLLPTPTGAGNEGSPSMLKWPAHRALAQLLATPTASGSDMRNTNRPSARALRVFMLPTPTAQLYGYNRDGAAGRVGKPRPSLEVLSGGVNIALREWIMGWPLGWSASEPLATDRFLQWLHAHGVSSPAPSESIMSEPAEQRVFSASALELADDSDPETGGCRKAWAFRYVDKIRKPEMQWEQCLAYAEWQDSVGGYYAAKGRTPPPGIIEPAGGQRSASCGTRTHLYAQWYLTGVATSDADVYGPRRVIDWESLPGQVLQSMLPFLPPAGTLGPEHVEAEFELEIEGQSGQEPVRFRGLIDILSSEAVEIWDHKTTRDIRGYALLPDAVALALGAPKRSLKDNLQSCIYAVFRARKSDPPAPEVTCRWTYGETDRSRRALPVVQTIPYAHALARVESAADVARTLTYATSDEAPANTLACDKYGGCWYRGRPCKARRDYGRIALQLEKEEKKMADTKKPMTFSELQKATAAANGKAVAAPKAAAKAPAKAAPVAAKPAAAPAKAKFTPKAPAKAAPAPEPEEIEEQEEETTDEEQTDAAPEGLDLATIIQGLLSSDDFESAVKSIVRSSISIG